MSAIDDSSTETRARDEDTAALGAPAARPTRFTPGDLLASRYRIVMPLGKGGMGEVYRADDIRLGQPVALKFLPSALASDSVRLNHLVEEVRIGRQISHPNVCRLYDIAEADGHQFLVMEYVDGEDLASLLRRIGRLPGDKALDIARDICAGLAAAHDKGIIHRDLKPANVMIDSHGHARLADFGLAALADGISAVDMSGTPHYMAPEQLTGHRATLRSDVYAIGLVVHEMLTGKRFYQAQSMAELRAEHERAKPSAISSRVKDVDLELERLIAKCLSRDPQDRPASARAVLVSLPGGDPLQAAVLAGETPSPEMVAAAATVGDLATTRAWILLACVLIGLGIASALAKSTALYRHVPFDKPPDALAERARLLVTASGHGDAPKDSVTWLEASGARNRGAQPVCFLYRQSPGLLEPRSGEVNTNDPPFQVPGMVSIVLSTEGRLIRFSAVPPSFDDTPNPGSPDWLPFLSAAAFDPSDMESVEPEWTPAAASDRRIAWQPRASGQSGQAVRIEAASLRGRPVDFRVIWAGDVAREKTGVAEDSFVLMWVIPLGNFIVYLAALVLARRNLMLGKSDRTGALRLAGFAFAVEALARLISAHHPPSMVAEARIIKDSVTGSLASAATLWLFYVALEPYARRRWPHMLIAWSRLLAGRVSDPLVGRDLLIGAMGGTLAGLVWHLGYFAQLLAGFDVPLGGVWAVSHPRGIPGELLTAAGRDVWWSLLNLFVLVLYRVIVRSGRAAALLLIATDVLFNLWWFGEGAVAIQVMVLTLIMSISTLVLVRFGLMALVAETFFLSALRSLPIALDFRTWYAGSALTSLGLLIGLTLLGFYASLGGKPLFGVDLLKA
ncbi:MAG: serine/threonine-protein kinase [Vicinamibacteria bacterium]